MNLLIVDDEPLEVAIIEQMIDKKTFDLEEVYIAYNMKQAIEVLESHEISILLSDIQMPKGSGHELVQWSLAHGLAITSIFLTSHADFNYAREAIRLNVNEYLLKPVKKDDLSQALFAAIETVKERYQMEQNKRKAAYWQSNRALWKQEFWKKLLFEEGELSQEIVTNNVEKFGISYKEDMQVVPILVSWRRTKGNVGVWSNATIEFVLKNIASELFWGNTDKGNIIVERDKMIVLYEVKQETSSYIFSKCEIMIQQFLNYLDFCNVNAYINSITLIGDLKCAVDELLTVEKQDIKKEKKVTMIKQRNMHLLRYEKPNLKLWVNEIFSEHYKNSLSQVMNYLDKIKKSDGLGQEILSRFQHDFLQELYIILEEKGIQASSIFKEKQMVELFNEAIQSVENMEIWIEELVTFLVNFNFQTEKTPSMVEEVKAHIRKNLDGELSRNELARVVYLHPDYLSHIFKKQTGMGISDYIIEERINKALILLATTSLKISEIAMSIGYPNTAYFTKLFKRAMGVTPKEYRNSNERESIIE
ncbi:MAG: response regulator [Velocimicrobium sp.]